MRDLSASKPCSGHLYNDAAESSELLALHFTPETSLAEVGKVWAGTATVRTTGDIEAVLDSLLDALKQNQFSRQEIFGIHLSLT